MTIKEVSEKYNISADTIRYYERIGLLPPIPRKANGIRDFDEVSCNWIEFVKCMRNAGVQLSKKHLIKNKRPLCLLSIL